MSLEEMMARAREAGDVDFIFYETRTSFRVCVGDPLRPRTQRLKHFRPDRKHDAAAWLHRTILQLYPRSRYADRHGKAFTRPGSEAHPEARRGGFVRALK